MAICDGVVKSFYEFYDYTFALVVHHTTNDGREFIIRYGEIDPILVESLRDKNDKGEYKTETWTKTGEKIYKLEVNKEVKQGQVIGNVGELLKKDGDNLVNSVYYDNRAVAMLHLEYFTGNIKNGLTSFNLSGSNSYKRRSDIADALELLKEGYVNTIGELQE